MHRFFHPHLDVTKENFSIIDPKEIHHLKNVLRLKPANQIIIFNGKGEEILASIVSIKLDNIFLHMEKQNKTTFKKTTLTLACAVPKKEKFGFIIEKCTELGVDEIIPLKTKRTEFKMTEENLKKKNLRFERIAINAAKQSNRTTVPKIYPITKFDHIVPMLGPDALILIPCLFGPRKNIIEALRHLDKAPKKIISFIGPEGDFSEEEVNLIIKKGGIPISLGGTTLKVDTAALAVIATLNFYFNSND